jgi:hypothetical protein
MPTERICISMILLEPANKITHLNVEIKRRTISLTGFSSTSLVHDSKQTITQLPVLGEHPSI